MTALLLDTCALIWLGNGDVALSLDARRDRKSEIAALDLCR